MNYYVIPKSIPRVAFAHTYETSELNISHDSKKGFLEISYVECGPAYSEYADNTRVELPQESIGLMLYLQPQRSLSNGYHRHCTVAFDMDFELADTDAPNAIPFSEVVTETKFVAAASKIIQSCTRDILLDPNNGYKLTAHVFELFGLYRHHHDENKLLSAADINYSAIRYVKQAKEYILSHIKEKITIDGIANALHLSRGYLSEIFKAVCSVSIVRYVNELRLESIKNLIIKESATLAEACELMGMDDPNYVSRMFKKYYGMSITEIINRN